MQGASLFISFSKGNGNALLDTSVCEFSHIPTDIDHILGVSTCIVFYQFDLYFTKVLGSSYNHMHS